MNVATISSARRPTSLPASGRTISVLQAFKHRGQRRGEDLNVSRLIMSGDINGVGLIRAWSQINRIATIACCERNNVVTQLLARMEQAAFVQWFERVNRIRLATAADESGDQCRIRIDLPQRCRGGTLKMTFVKGPVRRKQASVNIRCDLVRRIPPSPQPIGDPIPQEKEDDHQSRRQRDQSDTFFHEFSTTCAGMSSSRRARPQTASIQRRQEKSE